MKTIIYHEGTEVTRMEGFIYEPAPTIYFKGDDYDWDKEDSITPIEGLVREINLKL